MCSSLLCFKSFPDAVRQGSQRNLLKVQLLFLGYQKLGGKGYKIKREY